MNQETEQLVNLLNDNKVEDIQVISNPKIDHLIDYHIVISSVNSARHLNAIAHKLSRYAKNNHIYMHVDGFKQGSSAEWLCCDTGRNLVHLMLTETRQELKLEELYTS